MALTFQVISSATTVAPGAASTSAVATAADVAGDSVCDTLLPVDSAFADTVAVDTVVPDTILYLMMDAPAAPEFPAHDPIEEDTTGMSWILTALLALFVVVAIRFRSNSKYLSAMFRDAVEVRERGNAFDETVREKSFMIMLNVLWCISAGVLLYTLVEWSLGQEGVRRYLLDTGLANLPPHGFPSGEAPLGMGICICLTCVWQILMVMAYTIVGNVFNDATHTRMWVTGYLAVTGLSTLIFFPLALMAVCYTDRIPGILAVALGGFIVAKLIFIWKGFRIFFRQIASWLLFLYYLCSLEIVPLILLYGSTLLVCATIL